MPAHVVCCITVGRTTRFRDSMTFRTRSKPDIFPGGHITSLLKVFFTTNTTLRNGPGKEHQGLPIFFSIPSKNMLGILKGYLGYLGYSRPMEDLGLSQHRGQFPNQF